MMNSDQQFSGAPAQGNDGVGAPLPPPVPQGQRRDWDTFYDVFMASNARQKQALLQVEDRLVLLEDIQRQAEAGESK